MRTALTLLGCALLASCATKTAPVAPARVPVPAHEGEGGGRCPAAMWRAGELRPGGIQIDNRSADSVLVFLDRCLGHTRVGDLGPSEVGLFELPNGAVSYNGRLRFFTYRGPQRTAAVEFVTPVGDPYLRLVVPERPAAECPEVWVDGVRVDTLARIPRERIESLEYEAASASSGCARIRVKLKG